MNPTSPITTHVLDLATGRPASGVVVTLARIEADDRARPLASGTTDLDGRIRDLLPPGHALDPGTYRLRFATRDYFAAQGVQSFHPTVAIDFAVDDPGGHYHVPLLLSPFGYSTYRGS